MADAAGWDDVTMLAVGCLSDTTREAVRVLSEDPTAVRTARRFVTAELSGWGLDQDAVDNAVLCVSELVTNALLHGGSAAEVRVELDAYALTVTVTDHGGETADEAVDAPQHEDVELVSGRGLALVEALTSGWGSERTADGTAVWFELLSTADLPTGATDA